MGETIGGVNFIVDLDGSIIPAQATKIGTIAGRLASKAFDAAYTNGIKALGGKMRTQFSQLGARVGASFARAFGKQTTSSIGQSLNGVSGAIQRAFSGKALSAVNGIGTAVERVGQSMQRSFDQPRNAISALGGELDLFNGKIRDSADGGEYFASRFGGGLDRLTGQMRDYVDGGSYVVTATQGMDGVWRDSTANTDAAGDSYDRAGRRLRGFSGVASSIIPGLRNMGASLREFSDGVDRTDKPTRKFFGIWKNLPAGFRRVAFYTGLFAALGSEIAVLGSVAGSSLAVLGTALTAVGVAALVGVVGFQGILGDLANLGPNAQIAQAGLFQIRDAFAALQSGIQESLFAELGPALGAVAGLAPVLAAGLNGVASALGGVGVQLIGALTSTRGVEVLTGLLEGFGPIVTNLGGAFISLGSAIGSIFLAAIPSTQAFASSLNDIFTRFADFLSSAEGQSALSDFFGTLASVMPNIVLLLGATGSALASLVTPETIGLLNLTLQNLALFMPALSGLLGIIALLNPIGLIAQLLAEVGTAVAPLGPVFADLARTLNGTLSEAISTLAPVIGELIAGLAPLFVSLVGLIAALVPALLPVVTSLADVAITILSAVMPALTGFIGFLTDNTDLVLTLASVIAGAVAAFSTFTAIAGFLAPIAGILATIIETVALGGSVIGGLMAALSITPIGLIITAVVALVAGIVYLATQTTFFQDAWAAVVSFVTASVEVLGDVFSNIGTFISDVASNIGGFFAGIGEAIVAHFVGVGTAIISFFQPLIDFFSTVVGIAGAVFGGLFQIIGAIGGAIFEVVASIVGAWLGLLGILIQPFVTGFELIIGYVAGFIGMITDGWQMLVDGITSVLGFVGLLIISYFQPFVDGVLGFIDLVNAGWNILVSYVTAVLGNIGNAIVAFFLPFVTGVLQFIADVQTGYNLMVAYITAILGNIGSTIASYFAVFVTLVRGYVDSVVQFFQAAPGLISGYISGIGDKVAGFFDDIPDKVKGFVDDVVNFFRDLPSRIMGFVSGLGSRIAAAINPGNILSGLGINLPFTAEGGVFGHGQARIIGEAGPEAVVPLNRPLSQVNPAVRELSAYAQGIGGRGGATAAQSSGTTIGRTATVEAGAITVISPAPQFAGAQVLDALANRL